MPAKQCADTDKALALLGKPKPGGGVYNPSDVARKYNLARSTVYRAVKRSKK